ncbi:hypothetical protein E4U52_005019 [Claviceps spartinae]|nr:hypothetical protein E4U52_005019 [Claviceps spartinae]
MSQDSAVRRGRSKTKLNLPESRDNAQQHCTTALQRVPLTALHAHVSRPFKPVEDYESRHFDCQKFDSSSSARGFSSDLGGVATETPAERADRRNVSAYSHTANIRDSDREQEKEDSQIQQGDSSSRQDMSLVATSASRSSSYFLCDAVKGHVYNKQTVLNLELELIAWAK